ncbi:MAG TPA: TIGR03557 family F420-dependent LLM class oxidoreductase [Acidimicrobiales bacterium]|nr:TIGR03557 family F420-dependent LLM class oxidoreductase [Acidimicrobiales bacterium]
MAVGVVERRMTDQRPLEVGYWMSSEEHPPAHLVEHAARAEAVGFRSAMISDHFHPWTARQGQGPFVWAVLGAIARATEELQIGTGVTAPILRVHPVIVAQAAATAATLMPGRFFLGVGSGENLNEHVVGMGWPRIDVRLDMLEEAIALIRRLWTGDNVTHRGAHFTVEDARVFTRPDEPPPIMVAGSGERSLTLAGRVGDGLVAVSPSAEDIETFEAAGGAGKPRLGQVHVCWAETEAEARRTALEWWPNGALPGALLRDLARPEDFEAAAGLVGEDDVSEVVVCGPDPERHLDAIAAYASAGFDHVYLHQVGPDQEGLFEFYRREVRPRLG